MGNCEESLAEGSSDCGCGFEEGTRCRHNGATVVPLLHYTGVTPEPRMDGHLPRRIQIHYGHRK